jgi:hypothetical protein
MLNVPGAKEQDSKTWPNDIQRSSDVCGADEDRARCGRCTLGLESDHVDPSFINSALRKIEVGKAETCYNGTGSSKKKSHCAADIIYR